MTYKEYKDMLAQIRSFQQRDPHSGIKVSACAPVHPGKPRDYVITFEGPPESMASLLAELKDSRPDWPVSIVR